MYRMYQSRAGRVGGQISVLFNLSCIIFKVSMGRLTCCPFLFRRENKLRIQNGWLCHLAPEIIHQLSPDTEEDKLPFSKHSDVFAFG